MDKPKVFIDGREGTTGLQLWERLSRRTDLELLRIGEARRKDPAERKKYLNAADLVFLCLPDAAAWEAVGLIENGHTRIIDASTAHRTASGWVYGFPELYKDPERIIGQARRVANPGCHATGFLASAAPLSALHILLRDCPLTCFSLTGYSGGGRKMIAQYEAPDKPAELFSPRLYGTGLRHKHLTEMQKVAGLEQPPVFCPVVDDYYKGMATTIQLHNRYLRGQPTAREICHILAAYYAGQPLVSVRWGGDAPTLPANALAGTDRLELVQGEGGVLPMDRDFVRALAGLCEQRDWLLLVDEVQTGIGRTGTLFAFQQYGIRPDAVSFAKGIAGGLPMGGFLVNEKCRPVLGPGSHASTFGGNPVCSAAALAVLDILDEAALNRVREKGIYLREHIEAMGKQCLGATRGLGLMIGVEVRPGWSSRELAARLAGHGLLVLTAGPALRLLPPLTITKGEMDQGLAILDRGLE